MAEKFYRPNEVAEICKVSRETVGRWAREGTLHTAATTPGGHRRFSKEDVVAMLKKHNREVPAELK